MTLADFIRQHLPEDVDRKDVAEAAGVGRSTLYTWLDGRIPEWPNLRAFCEAVGISEDGIATAKGLWMDAKLAQSGATGPADGQAA